MSARFFPSIPAAIVVGAVGMPLFMLGVDLIQERFGGGLLFILWMLLGFMLPFAAATVDLREVVRSWKRWGVFSLRGALDAMSGKSIRLSLIPAWIRMGVWFVSTVGSSLLLKALGLDL